jgi:hypothetical protein
LAIFSYFCVATSSLKTLLTWDGLHTKGCHGGDMEAIYAEKTLVRQKTLAPTAYHRLPLQNTGALRPNILVFS